MARYDKVVLLGSGSYGKVWLVEADNSTRDQKVLKEIQLKGLGDKEIEQALTEVAILAKCRHENIIAYTEAFVDKKTAKLSIVMDYASGGDLHKQITQRRGLYFPNETVLSWFSQLVFALSYIHKKGIIHRDIKPQNLFLSDRNVLKLGDFGISRILHSDGDVALTFIGTPFYLSPEICSQQPYSYKSDMWSAGCVLYEMCCLHVAFTAVNLPSLVAQIKTGIYKSIPSHCSGLLHDLVDSLLTSDPEKRLSADDVLLIPELQVYLKGRTEMSPQPLKERLLNLNFQGNQHESRSKKRSIQPNNMVTDMELVSQGDSACYKKGADDKLDMTGQICNTTYTVVKHPKLRHMSFASPELSAALARQRTLLSEPQRALSADAPRVNRHKKNKIPPRLNLFQAVQPMKPRNDDHNEVGDYKVKESCANLENVTETVYNCVIMESKQQDAVTDTLSFLQTSLGQQMAEEFITVVRSKTSYKNLQKRFDIQPSILLAALWHIKLSDSLYTSSASL